MGKVLNASPVTRVTVAVERANGEKTTWIMESPNDPHGVITEVAWNADLRQDWMTGRLEPGTHCHLDVKTTATDYRIEDGRA